jgi:hypothetical protein
MVRRRLERAAFQGGTGNGVRLPRGAPRALLDLGGAHAYSLRSSQVNAVCVYVAPVADDGESGSTFPCRISRSMTPRSKGSGTQQPTVDDDREDAPDRRDAVPDHAGAKSAPPTHPAARPSRLVRHLRHGDDPPGCGFPSEDGEIVSRERP